MWLVLLDFGPMSTPLFSQSPRLSLFMDSVHSIPNPGHQGLGSEGLPGMFRKGVVWGDWRVPKEKWRMKL